MKFCLAISLLCCICCSSGNGLEMFLQRTSSQVQCNDILDISRVGRNRGYSRYRSSRYTNEGPLVCRYISTQDVFFDYQSQEEAKFEAKWINPERLDINATSRSGSFYVSENKWYNVIEISLHNYNADRDTGVYCCQAEETVHVAGSGMQGDTDNETTTSSCCVGLYRLSRCSPTLDNGEVTYNDSLTSGRSVEFSCNSGFKLIGNDSATCTPNGLSERTPSCAYECGPLENPLNGHVDTSQGTTDRNTATYSCKEGYHLVGQSTRTCLYYRSQRYYSTPESGWTGSPPICVDSAKIQVKFSHGQNCMLWESRKVSTIESTLKSAIRQSLMDSNHSTLENNTEVFDIVRSRTPGTFSCRTTFTETTYRTTVYGREQVSAREFADIIQEWVSTGPIVQLEWYLVDIDKNCPVRITSEFEPECMKNSSTYYY